MRAIFFLIYIALTSPLCLFACECGGILNRITKKEQLNTYDFIAIVHIDNIVNIPTRSTVGYDSAKIIISIKELFKGDSIKNIIEDYHFTSCGYGLEINSEWLLYAYQVAGQYHIKPCDRNIIYRNIKGERFLEFNNNDSIPEFKILRKIFDHKKLIPENGPSKFYYPNGAIEIEENYTNYKLNGERKLYYANGKLESIEHYQNNLLDGEITSYYETGQLSYKESISKGKNIGVSIGYSDSSESYEIIQYLIQNNLATKEEIKSKFKSIYINEENYFSKNGDLLICRRYFWNGNVSHEEIPLNNDSLKCFDYHMNGKLKRVYLKNSKTWDITSEMIIE